MNGKIIVSKFSVENYQQLKDAGICVSFANPESVSSVYFTTDDGEGGCDSTVHWFSLEPNLMGELGSYQSRLQDEHSYGNEVTECDFETFLKTILETFKR